MTVSTEALFKLCPVLIRVPVPRAPTPPIWRVSVMPILYGLVCSYHDICIHKQHITLVYMFFNFVQIILYRNPLQYSCLENPMDRGAWWATVHRVAQSQTRLKWFSTHTCTLLIVCAFSLQNVTCLRFICAESAALIQSFLCHVDGHFGFLQLLLLQTKLNEHLGSYLLVTHERDSRYTPRRGMVGWGVHPDTSASRLNGASEVMPQRPASWEPRWSASQETLCPGAGASTLTTSDHDQSIQKLYPKSRIYGEGGGCMREWLCVCVSLSVWYVYANVHVGVPTLLYGCVCTCV